MSRLTDTIKKIGLYNVIKSIGYDNINEVLGEDFKPTKDMMINVLQEATKEYPNSFSYVINGEVITVNENHIVKFGLLGYLEERDDLTNDYSFDIKYKYDDDEVNNYLPELYENVLDYMKTI